MHARTLPRSAAPLKQKLAALAVAALALALPARHAAAEMPAAIPSDATVALWIDDTQGFWQKAATLPVTRGLQQFLKNPLLAQQLPFQSFQLELDKIESKLGYEASLDQFLGSVFKSLTFFSAPGGTADNPVAAISLAVADEAKAAKLLEVLDAALREDAATTGSTSPTVFSEATIAGKALTHFSGEGEGYYGLVDGKQFVIASTEAAATQAIAGFAGEKARAANADYDRLAKAVDPGEGDLALWLDANALAGDAAQAVAGPLGALTNNKMLLSMKVTPTGLEGKAANTADPAAISPNIKPGALSSLVYIAAQPLLGGASHQFDAELVVNQMDQAARTAAAMQGNPNASPIQAFEAMSGLSMPVDVVPAFGDEVLFAVNSLAPNPAMPFFPMPDLLLGAKIKDQAKMQQLLQKLEAAIEAKVAEQGAAQGAAPQTFATAEGGIRTFSAFGGIGLSYLIDGEYVLFGLTPATIQAAVMRKDSPATSLKESASVKDVFGALSGSEYYDAGTINVSRIVTEVLVPFVLPMATQNAGAQGDPGVQIGTAFLSDVISHVGTVSGASTQQDGLSVGRVKVVMQ